MTFEVCRLLSLNGIRWTTVGFKSNPPGVVGSRLQFGVMIVRYQLTKNAQLIVTGDVLYNKRNVKIIAARSLYKVYKCISALTNLKDAMRRQYY
jgi:hypothetical protein